MTLPECFEVSCNKKVTINLKLGQTTVTQTSLKVELSTSAKLPGFLSYLWPSCGVSDRTTKIYFKLFFYINDNDNIDVVMIILSHNSLFIDFYCFYGVIPVSSEPWNKC